MTETTTEKARMHALALSTTERIEADAKAYLLLERIKFGTTLADVRNDDGERGVEAVMEARDRLELEPLDATHGEDETGDVSDGLEEWLDNQRDYGALSISRHGVNHGDGWETTMVQIVLGTGGPHVEVQYRGDSATVVAYGWFGADRVELPVDADSVDLLYSVDYLYNDEDG